MDAIGTSGIQPHFRSWDQTLLKQKGGGKSNFFSGGENASVHPIKVYIPLNTPMLRYAQATNKIFADDTATTSIDSIEKFFKNENLQATSDILFFAKDGENGAFNTHSREELETNLAKGNGLSVSTKQGTSVNVQCGKPDDETSGSYQFNISRNDGFQLSFQCNDNVRINDLEDGGLSIFYASTGETHMYDAEGNQMSVTQGEAGALVGTDGDDLLINLNGTSVEAGDGDDTIVNFADNATLTGGNGDDTILLGRTVTSNSIDAGEGNDRLLGLGAYKGSSVDMGNGDNSVQLGYLGKNSKLIAGDGNNEITIGMIADTLPASNGTSIHLGNGNNILRANSLYADVRLGDGNNTIIADDFMEDLSAGDGNNTVDIRSAHEGSVTFGNGGNTVSVDSLYSADLVLGDGNNSVDVRASTNTNTTLGNGNNAIMIDSFSESKLRVGDGNNTSSIRSLYGSSAAFGKGDNTVTVDSRFGSNLLLGENTDLIIKALKAKDSKPSAMPRMDYTV